MYPYMLLSLILSKGLLRSLKTCWCGSLSCRLGTDILLTAKVVWAHWVQHAHVGYSLERVHRIIRLSFTPLGPNHAPDPVFLFCSFMFSVLLSSLFCLFFLSPPFFSLSLSLSTLLVFHSTGHLSPPPFLLSAFDTADAGASPLRLTRWNTRRSLHLVYYWRKPICRPSPCAKP